VSGFAGSCRFVLNDTKTIGARTGISIGVHDAGRNREAPNFPRGHFDVADLIRFLETHETGADDRGHLDRGAMK
jgi:hypothetical protein